MKHRNLKYQIVDVFGETKYSGNQLAVFTNAKEISSEEMASIAREINFSETTFITDYNRKNKLIDTRIFTPGGEVDFAGHPTLGTAYIANKVFFEGKSDSITLNLKVGKVPVVEKDGLLWMTQVQPKFGEVFSVENMAEILGIESDDIDTRFPIEFVSTGLPFYMVPLKRLDTMRKIKLDMQMALEYFQGSDTQQMLVFSPEAYSSEDIIACRVFVPGQGILEDPATGSANGCLAAYLLKHKYFEKTEINISVAQGYEIQRPSRLHLKASLRKDIFSLEVGGKVVEIAEGVWY